jgi:hypothetical protein
MSEKAEPKNDKITPAERSEHSPDPFGGGGWGVGVNRGINPKTSLLILVEVSSTLKAAP